MKWLLKRGERKRKEEAKVIVKSLEADMETVQVSEQRVIKTDIPEVAEMARDMARKMREEKIQQQFLPKPTIRRRLIPHRERIPAVQHDLGKHFKGKGKHHHKAYRASVKAHKKIDEDEL